MTDNGDDIPRPQQVCRPAELAEPAAPCQADDGARGRQRFAHLLDKSRRAAVLVALGRQGSLWTADHGRVRWPCAFSDVPKPAGPAGVALDAGSADGVLFPPVRGIVSDAVAVDLGGL